MNCFKCGEPVSLREALVEVTGWVRRRKGGGSNHLFFRKETGRLMCPVCALRLRYSGEQLAMFEETA